MSENSQDLRKETCFIE